ncbi:MAG: pyridoxine 5'-phosphate synthase [Proteobacteria bacterium]|nr:pyridoxine 5'-phosphate synthase [Pseudomonadota bacterium]
MHNPIYLGVNVDHVATIRQARGTIYPDPVTAALIAEQHGADGITVHLREDKRHIQPRDVKILKETCQTRLNFEMAVSDEMVAFALEIQPKYCCLVPEKRQELTTEGGLDVVSHFSAVKKATHQLMDKGIEVSLFIDADEKQIAAAKETGAGLIEIHTGGYADATSEKEQAKILQQIQKSAKFAHGLGLQVNAGHGLHYHNVQPIAAIPEIIELNIGHAIIAHAIMVGMPQAVREMKNLMTSARYR